MRIEYGMVLLWPSESALFDPLGLTHKEDIKKSPPKSKPVFDGVTRLQYRSPVPLAGEEISQTEYIYDFTITDVAYNIITLTSANTALSEEILRYINTGPLSPVPILKRTQAKIDDLVQIQIDRKESISHNYTLCSVFCKVIAHGENLRTITYYGDDIASSRLFTEQKSSTVAIRAGFKRSVSERIQSERQPHLGSPNSSDKEVGDNEVLQIGNRGQVSLNVGSKRDIDAALSMLNYMISKKLLV